MAERGVLGGGVSPGPVGTGPEGDLIDGWTGPPRGEPLDSGPEAAAAETEDVIKGVTFFTKDTDKGWELAVQNGNIDWVVATVKMLAPPLNAKSPQTFPISVTLAPSSARQKVADIVIVDAKQKSHHGTLDFDVQSGDPNAKPDATLYGFPFAKGATFKCVQTFGGKHSHVGSKSVDFEMPVGTPVHAAREGVVVKTKTDSNTGGNDPKFESDSNFIEILHADRTYGRYEHLQQAGSKVSVGDKVIKGFQIGTSGNTGYSAGPHLHFEVAKADGKGGMKSIDWGFEKDGKKYVPKEGEQVTNK